MTIKNLYDSHSHLLLTGQVAAEPSLSGLRSIEDLAQVKFKPEVLRGPWRAAFGWDENSWPGKRLPTRHDLDRLFPEEPVYLSRCDGHSSVTNTAGLKLLGYWDSPPEIVGGQILLGEDGRPNGRLTENAHYRAMESLPAHTEEQLRLFLREGIRRFNAAGFTHMRDMSGTEFVWNLARRMEDRGEQTLHVDWNFTCENRRDFDRALREAVAARKDESRFNKVAGIKFYFDGSLGSDTAYLSQPYAHRSDGSRGITCWPENEVEELITRSWEEGFPVAVHTIGDEAVDRIVEIARKVSAGGLGGRLNLEHAEVVRFETIQKMKGLHVTCHLQPCHWLTDRRWLKEKLGGLAENAFPWEALRRARIPFFFGSDSPIEPPSLFDNLRALRESAGEGIKALQADPLSYHVHPGGSRVEGETVIENDRVVEVRLDGKTVFSA